MVPGAGQQDPTACLTDLTTPGLVAIGNTDSSDWATLTSIRTAAQPPTPGMQVDGGPVRTRPGDALLAWHERVTQPTRAANATVGQVCGSSPRRTYMRGISNGGYLTRWALEHHPELDDGGVDWASTLFTPQTNLFTYLPTALQHYPAAETSPADHDAIIAAGLAPGSEPLWKQHYAGYWDLTQRAYREEFDPTYDGSLKAGVPFCRTGPGCDTLYDYASRPTAVRDAVRRVSLTGRIGRAMLTLHGTLDALLPIAKDRHVYNRMVDQAGGGALHRCYVIEAGNHVDQLADVFPDVTRPILPGYYRALDALDRWVGQGVAPPPGGTVPRPTSGDLARTCATPGQR